ncbi:Uncharacterized protein DR_A0282 [Deinococcus saxicola]|uniref:Ig-like domain-containing protein n=1 Tax=Deinococcus saxicola TaxID=249406 RepID=UPI0039F0448C
MKRSSPLAFLALTGFLLTACGGSETPQTGDTTKPTVSLTASPSSVQPGDTVTLTASASDNVGVFKVSFYQGTTLINEDSIAPYTATTTVDSAASGTVTYRAVASDAAGNTAEATATVSVNVNTAPTVVSVIGTGPSTLSVDLVRSDRGVGVTDSTAYLYKSGDRSVAVGKATTNTQGYAEFAGIPEGRYDLVFIKTGWAGSAFNGAVAQGTVNNRLKVAQYESADPKATPDVPQLKLETPTGLTASGEVQGWKDLTAGMAFNNVVNVRAYTVKNSETPRVMRSFQFSLVTIDENGNWADVQAPRVNLDPGYVKPGEGEDAQDSKLVTLNATGLKGDVYLQVSGLDFNYNRVAYLVPITINQTAAVGAVTAPGKVSAVSYTLSERINFRYGAAQPDAPTSGTNLWVTTSWDAPVDLGGYTGFRILRADSEAGPYKQVAFAGSAQCAAPAKGATTRRCQINDTTATLQTDKDYFYKVGAVGSNDVSSAVARTYTLSEFRPKLLTPVKDGSEVSLTPDYTIKLNAFQMGATGVRMDLQVTDLITGSSYGYLAKRLIIRKDFDTAKKAEYQVLSNLIENNFYFVYRENGPADENDTVTYNAASDILSVPHQFEATLLGSAIKPLQANRRYSWLINKANAYRVADPSQPASATNPIVAYSVYSDPDSARLITPGGIRQQYTEVNDFTTRK